MEKYIEGRTWQIKLRITVTTAVTTWMEAAAQRKLCQVA